MVEKTITLTGTSTNSIEDAVGLAVNRAAAARTSSPHSTKPHGKHQRPAPNCPGARWTRSTRPAASRRTHAAPTPGLAKKMKPQRGQLGRGMPPRTTRASAVRHLGHATQSSPGKGIRPAG